jgi:hypothetical protein
MDETKLVVKKPVVRGRVDGNVFSVIGIVKRTLQRAGQEREAADFVARAFRCGSYDEVLVLAMDVVEFDL